MENTEIKMEKKGLFVGFRDVLSFTANQNAKASGFKVSTILIGLLFLAISAAICIIMSVVQLGDKKDSDNGAGEDVIIDADSTEVLADISTVYLVNTDALKEEYFKGLIDAAMPLTGVIENPIKVELVATEDEAKDKINKDGNAMYVTIAIEEEDDITFSAYINDTSNIDYEVVDVYMENVLAMMNNLSYISAGITAQADILVLEAPYFTQSLRTDEKANGMAVSLTSLLVPMLVSSVMYIMIVMHSQSISKSVVAEKTSKLMEFMLTSVRPYGLIAGKVVALVGMALIQVFIWIGCLVGGYFIGDIIAKEIYPEYINYVELVIEMMKLEGGLAFSFTSVVMAFVAIILGFTLYCVLAALVSSSVSKIEEMSSVMSLFQLPVMVGWMIAYIGPIFEDKTINTVVNIVPFTSAFCLPANLVLGKCSMVEGLISLVLLLVVSVAAIIVTGKIYKAKVFYRK
jgi:ABC-type Na+ efflux pump permease subunit